MIEIMLDSEVVEAGQFLSGSVRWASDGQKRVARLIVAAEWKTSGAGNTATGVGRSQESIAGVGQTEGSFPFRLLIPYEGPISFEGELITMSWQVRARVDQSGFDDFAEAGFRVDPRHG